MLSLQHRIRQDIDKIAKIITEENGKTLIDSKGDIIRGLEVVEHACGILKTKKTKKLTKNRYFTCNVRRNNSKRFKGS